MSCSLLEKIFLELYLFMSIFAWELNIQESYTQLSFSELQLLRIEEELGPAAIYAGTKFRTPVEPY